MFRNLKGPSTSRRASVRRQRQSLVASAENVLCKHGDGRIVSGSDGSIADSTTSIERNFMFGTPTRHVSESFMIKATFGNVPDFVTMQELEYKQRARSIPNFLSGGAYGYTHNVYEVAADIFERLAERSPDGCVQYPAPKEDSLPPVFTSQRIKRQAYELAYETLKYQELLEEMLSESDYFFEYPANDDTTALIMVLLFDFQNRKWTPRCHIIGEKRDHHISELENSLYEHRVKLAAALAKCRVKHQSQSIDYVLHDNVRQQEKCASTLPQYAWVNTAKSSTEAVIESLKENQYEEFEDNDVLIPQKGKFYRKDLHCDDVLVFPSDQKEALKCLEVIENGDLVLQDKTSSLAARSVGALLTEDDECDLIHTEIGSGLTTAHLAMILCNITKKRMEAKEYMTFGRNLALQSSNLGLAGPSHATTQLGEGDDLEPQPTVYAFGLRNEEHYDKMAQFMLHMGLLNVKLIREKFEDIDHKHDSRFDRVKAILVTPQCTRTAVANPVEFMLNEGDKENYDTLKDLSHGERHKKAVEAGLLHMETLKAALRFPHAQSVVYVTRSTHGHENEQVVNDSIKWHREFGEGVRSFKVCPPTLPILSNEIEKRHRFNPRSITHPNHNFLRMRQTAQMNGCFIAVLTREMDGTDPAMVRDVLRRAALQGLITPIGAKSEEAEPPTTSGNDPFEEADETLAVDKLPKPVVKVAHPKRTKPAERPLPLQAAKRTIVPKQAVVLNPVDAIDVHNLFTALDFKTKEKPMSPFRHANLTLSGANVNSPTKDPRTSDTEQGKAHSSQTPHSKKTHGKHHSGEHGKHHSGEHGKHHSVEPGKHHGGHHGKQSSHDKGKK